MSPHYDFCNIFSIGERAVYFRKIQLIRNWEDDHVCLKGKDQDISNEDYHLYRYDPKEKECNYA